MSHLFIKVRKAVVLGVLFTTGLLLFSSCYKRGCMDKDAENYEPGAVKDCGCCYYYGKAYVMMGLDDGLFVYADGKKVKEVFGPLGYPSAPDAHRYYGVYTNERDKRIVEFSLDGYREKKFNVLVTDQFHRVLFSGTVTIKANQIVLIE